MATAAGVSYVRLDGTVGCLINGAGLAMEILDLIRDAGGSAANFLDVGGAADGERLAAAFGILAADRRVRAGLVSIFGGILRCELVAEALVRATASAAPTGRWWCACGEREQRGRAIIAASGLPLIYEDDLFRAVERAVELAGKEGTSWYKRIWHRPPVAHGRIPLMFEPALRAECSMVGSGHKQRTEGGAP